QVEQDQVGLKVLDELLCFATGVDGGDAIAAGLEGSTERTGGVGVVLDEEYVRSQTPTLPRSAGDFYPPKRFCCAHCYAERVSGSRSNLKVRHPAVGKYLWPGCAGTSGLPKRPTRG